MISPTDRFFHFTFTHWPFCKHSISLLLVSSSARWRFCLKSGVESYKNDILSVTKLTKSSMISLSALTVRMNMSGTKVVYRPVGDTSGICWRRAMNRKKQFEYRRNCSNKNDGMKLKALEREVTEVSVTQSVK